MQIVLDMVSIIPYSIAYYPLYHIYMILHVKHRWGFELKKNIPYRYV